MGAAVHGGGLRQPTHTRQEWALIADAIHAADRTLTPHPTPAGAQSAPPGTVGPPVRGDAAWCQTALDTYAALQASGAYRHLRSDGERHCHADEHTIRAWLDAPAAPPTADTATMLHANGFLDLFVRGQPPQPRSLSALVGAAQDVGAFGLPEYRIEVWQYADPNALTMPACTITVRPPNGPGLTSAVIDAHHLARPSADPVDGIVAALRRIAATANQLLTHHDRADHNAAPNPAPSRDGAPAALPAGVDGHPVGTRGRPFLPLAVSPAGPPTTLPRNPAPPGPPSGRSARN